MCYDIYRREHGVHRENLCIFIKSRILTGMIVLVLSQIFKIKQKTLSVLSVLCGENKKTPCFLW